MASLTRWIKSVWQGPAPFEPGAAGSYTEALLLRAEVIRHYRRGRPAEAASAARRLVDWQRRTLGPDHPDVAAGLANLGQLLLMAGDPRAAAAARAEADRIRAGVPAPSAPPEDDDFGPDLGDDFGPDPDDETGPGPGPGAPPELAVFELLTELEGRPAGDAVLFRACVDSARSWRGGSDVGRRFDGLLERLGRTAEPQAPGRDGSDSP